MFYILFSSLISLLMSFALISNPMSLSLNILILAFISSILISFFSSWMAILMFLIYISGMLIMFIYFAAISMKKKMEFINSFPMMIFIFFNFLIFYPFSNLSLNYMFDLKLIPSSIYLLLNSNYNMLIFLIMFLFLSLIIVVKIIFSNKSPLRPFK
uniref:NADH dehydrogenase subunit 6 n=1 Tax=Spirobrachia sp. YL-2014 TaxID=1535021 RepID=A0A0E3DR27_9ANNE|nr:NADH dehydrogenase subunit 6 [Spirobrachia sp. YL-2014]